MALQITEFQNSTKRRCGAWGEWGETLASAPLTHGGCHQSNPQGTLVRKYQAGQVSPWDRGHFGTVSRKRTLGQPLPSDLGPSLPSTVAVPILPSDLSCELAKVSSAPADKPRPGPFIHTPAWSSPSAWPSVHLGDLFLFSHQVYGEFSVGHTSYSYQLPRAPDMYK